MTENIRGQSAQSIARTKLTHMFQEEYDQYYKEEISIPLSPEFRSLRSKSQIRARAQTRAKTRLSRAHETEYRKLYIEAIQKGYPNK